jgi:hypothetical protein
MVKALASRGQQQKAKPAAVMDYSKYIIDVDKSIQMLTYYSFQIKKSKVVEESFLPSLLLLFHKCEKKEKISHYSCSMRWPVKTYSVMHSKIFRNEAGALLLAGLPEEVIFHMEFQQHRQM